MRLTDNPLVHHASEPDPQTTVLRLQDGLCVLIDNFIPTSVATHLQPLLRESLEWEQSTIRLFGRQVKIPRLNAWYGDADCEYSYSGTRFQPTPWTAELQQLKRRCSEHCDTAFNSVLANLYRDGQDCMGWHSDNEKSLGQNPTIASISFGTERRFLLRHRSDQPGQRKISLTLKHGSLLIMSGSLQHHWKHALPRSKPVREERINLTFRQIHP